jgi:glycosyltransferase involved in cell wall biosynthesis
MKILIITHIYPPAVDGGSKIVAKIGDYFATNGHQTMVLTSDCQTTDDFINPQSTPITGHSQNVFALPVYKTFRRPLKLFNILLNSSFVRILQKGPIFKILPFIKTFFIISHFRPDLIIAGPLPTTIIFYAGFFKKLTSAKLLTVACFHPADADFQNPAIKKALSSSDFVNVFTPTEKTLIDQFYRGNVIIQPPGVDADFLIDSDKITFPKNPNILFIANFSAHKRTELLLQAYSRLLSTHPGLTLTLLGQKTLYWPAIQDQIRTLHLHPQIIFNPSRLQIKQAIDNSTLLCLPSVHESFGLVLAESLARGKPVIGADTPQTSEVIQLLGGGLTFKTDNLSDLVKNLEKLIDHPVLASRLGHTGYLYVKNHLTWDKIGKSLCSKILP